MELELVPDCVIRPDEDVALTMAKWYLDRAEARSEGYEVEACVRVARVLYREARNVRWDVALAFADRVIAITARQ